MISSQQKQRTSAPIIYLLSICSDSTPPVEEAAKKTKTELNSISIGQCREEIAEATIQQAKHIGELVLLQNCHLGLKYMNKLFEMYKEDIADAEATKESQNAQNDAKDKKPGKNRKGQGNPSRLQTLDRNRTTSKLPSFTSSAFT